MLSIIKFDEKLINTRQIQSKINQFCTALSEFDYETLEDILERKFY
jgi:hypothetical protein